MAHNCENCKFRARYDEKPNSFLGKFWRWHIQKKMMSGAFMALPENETIMAVIALDYRAEEPNRPERKNLDEIVKFF